MPDGSQTPTCTWTGASGKQYKYWVHPIGTLLKAEPGNYIFAKLNGEGLWEPVYIGETEDLSSRFDDHHAKSCIVRNGATHVHAHLTYGDRYVRLGEETDLRSNYRTHCNKQ